MSNYKRKTSNGAFRGQQLSDAARSVLGAIAVSPPLFL